MPEMSKRQLFLTSVAAAFLNSGGAAFARTYGHSLNTTLNELGGLFTHMESVRAIGRRYLLQASKHHKSDDLCRLLQDKFLHLAETSHWDSVSEDALDRLKNAVSDSIRADFGAGRVEMLDGWVLSQTEVQLCGLATLVDQKSSAIA